MSVLEAPSQAGVVPQVRVLVVDDHDVVRLGLTQLLGTQPDLLVVGTAADGRTAVDLVAAERPDVVLMDLSLPVLDGIEATRQIALRAPGTRVLVLSCFIEDAVVACAMDAGAQGYLVKHISMLEVVDAVRRTWGGEQVFSRGVSPARAAAVAASAVGPQRVSDPSGHLQVLPRINQQCGTSTHVAPSAKAGSTEGND
jgi:DNA-binding NarL/FixJ family response regulator